MAKEAKPRNFFSQLFSRLPVNFSGRPRGAEDAPAESPRPAELKLIFFIVDWSHAHVISQVFEGEKVRFHFISKGRGTASSEILDVLGIGASDKAVVICLEQAVLVPVLMKEVRKKIGFYTGAGIAFTVPLSGINSPMLRVFKQSIHKNEKITAGTGASAGGAEEGQAGGNPLAAGRGGIMASEFTHDLIISVINQGYSDEFMNTARAAGATGGTILNARGQAHEGAVKFFGISVQDEKEIIIMLTSREKKVPIMRAVCETHGLSSKAQGIVFSLPVENVLGLSFE